MRRTKYLIECWTCGVGPNDVRASPSSRRLQFHMVFSYFGHLARKNVESLERLVDTETLEEGRERLEAGLQ